MRKPKLKEVVTDKIKEQERIFVELRVGDKNLTNPDYSSSVVYS